MSLWCLFGAWDICPGIEGEKLKQSGALLLFLFSSCVLRFLVHRSYIYTYTYMCVCVYIYFFAIQHYFVYQNFNNLDDYFVVDGLSHSYEDLFTMLCGKSRLQKKMHNVVIITK